MTSVLFFTISFGYAEDKKTEVANDSCPWTAAQQCSIITCNMRHQSQESIRAHNRQTNLNVALRKCLKHLQYSQKCHVHVILAVRFWPHYSRKRAMGEAKSRTEILSLLPSVSSIRRNNYDQRRHRKWPGRNRPGPGGWGRPPSGPVGQIHYRRR